MDHWQTLSGHEVFEIKSLTPISRSYNFTELFGLDLNLLCRFYESDTGAITIDHIPITHIKLYDLRERIGLVTQENQVFHDTIWDNIRYSKPESTPEEVHRAISIAMDLLRSLKMVR